MAERSVLVKLQAQVGPYVSDMGRAEKATDKLADAQDKAGSKATESGRRHEESSQRQEQASKKTARQLTAEAASAQTAARAAGLKYDADGRLVDMQGRVVNSSQAAALGLDSFSDSVYLTARAAAQANPALEQTEGRLESLARKAKDVELAGQTLVGFGTVTVAGLGATAKAAMDWESAWAGVTKTVDGTPEQMAEVEAGLRGLARTLPATHQEIAAVAEAAGQLGVKREDVVGFTKTMIDLGETTNLTADEAATMIAQISNVMGTMERDGAEGVARFGSALVALGNDGASTEKDILSMAQRIAGAAATVGATEDEVLALSNALASMGIRAELGGGVTTRVLLKMFAAMKDGGDKMQKWADVAGVSAEQFADAYSDSPVKALDMVAQGLNRMNAEGGNVVATMRDLGLEGTEETQVMLALAASGNLLTDSLKLGAEAIQDTSALLEEANKRYETTESKVRIAWNNIKDAAIEAGAVILPAIASLAEAVSGLAGWFADLPAPVQGVITVLSGVAGVAALAVGGFILLFPRVMDTVDSFKKLQSHSSGAADGLGKVGKAASVAGAIAAVGLALAKIVESDYMRDIDTGMGRIADSFADVQTKGPGAADALDRIFQDRNGGNLTGEVDGLADALDRMLDKSGGQKFNDWAEGIIGSVTPIEGSSHIVKGAFERMDQGLSDLVSSGKAENAASIFAQATKWARDNGVEVERVAELFPQYADALSQASAEQKVAADGAEGVASGLAGAGDAAAAAAPLTEEAAEALEEVGLAADGTITSLDKYLEALFAAGLAHMSTQEATFGWAETLRGLDAEVMKVVNGQATMGAALNETGTKLNINTDAGKAASDMLIGVAREGLNVASVMANDVSVSQEEVQAQLSSTYDSLVTAHKGLGMLPPEAEAATRAMLRIPDNVTVESWMSDQAKAMAEATTGEMNKLDGRVVRTYIETRKTVFEDIVMGTSTQDKPRAGTGTVLRPGGALGGRVDDIMGFWSGGRVPGPMHPTGRQDNVLGMVNGKPIGLQGTEWVINPFSSTKYDKELAAINAGTFQQQSSTYAPAPVFTAPAGSGSGQMQFTGNLVLDSGEFLGTVRGIARSEANGTAKSLDNAIVRIGRGGKYAGGM
ncbi:phage tail tape measure protein [Arthrobacter koreensis]|uniref:phage tail tape measure protein n=1 Tax=Arthrobacter koreensis TaxID=199136 RepID=UPI0036DD67A6